MRRNLAFSISIVTRRAGLALGLASGFVLSTSAAWSQTYPDHAITMVVPFAAGGNGDIVARIVAEGLAAKLGNPVVVDNLPGAGGLTGAMKVQQAKPDGYTIMLNANALATNAALNPNSKVNMLGGFEHISQVTSSYSILVAPPNSPFKTLADLIDFAKKNPGKLSYASTGIASGAHLGSELIKYEAKIDMVHIPYAGGPQGTTDLLAGRVDLFWLNPATVIPLIEAGKVRALGTAQPTEVKAGNITIEPVAKTLPKFELNNWISIAAPKGTPPDVVNRLNAEIANVLKDPAYVGKFDALGVVLTPKSPAETYKLTADDIERWRAVTIAAGIKIQ